MGLWSRSKDNGQAHVATRRMRPVTGTTSQTQTRDGLDTDAQAHIHTVHIGALTPQQDDKTTQAGL